MDFKSHSLDQTISQAIKADLLSLYSLGKKTDEVKNDCKRAVKNITEWLELVFRPNKNSHHI